MPNLRWSDHMHEHQLPLPPTGGPLHTSSSALAPSALPAMKRVGFHLERSLWLTVWPARERCGPCDNCSSRAPHHLCLECKDSLAWKQRREQCPPGPQGPCTVLTWPATDSAHSQHAPQSSVSTYTCWTNRCMKVHVNRTSYWDQPQRCLAPSNQHCKCAPLQLVSTFQLKRLPLKKTKPTY